MSESGALQSHSVTHLPVGAFSVVMGIGGLSAAFNRASGAWTSVPAGIGEVLAWVSVAALATLLAAYANKAARPPKCRIRGMATPGQVRIHGDHPDRGPRRGDGAPASLEGPLGRAVVGGRDHHGRGDSLGSAHVVNGRADPARARAPRVVHPRGRQHRGAVGGRRSRAGGAVVVLLRRRHCLLAGNHADRAHQTVRARHHPTPPRTNPRDHGGPSRRRPSRPSRRTSRERARSTRGRAESPRASPRRLCLPWAFARSAALPRASSCGLRSD